MIVGWLDAYFRRKTTAFSLFCCMIRGYCQQIAGVFLQNVRDRCLLGAILLCIWCRLSAAEIGLYYLPSAKGNTYVCMRGVLAAQAAVSVVFWRGARAQIALQIRQTMVFKNGEAQWQLNLPAGAYRVAISIGNQAFSRTYTVPESQQQGTISDIFLAYSPAKQDAESSFLTGKNLHFSAEIISTQRRYWAILLRANAANQLSLRMVL